MGATFLSSRRTIQCFLFFFFFFLFFYSSKFFVGVMDMDRDFIAIKEELENIASGLRKLVVSEVDSPLESQTSPSSSTEGVGMKRLFKAEEDSEVASKTSSTDQLDWRPLFQSVELLPQSDESSSLSDLHLQRLFKEDKEVATSVSGVQLRKLLSRADPRSLSDLCLAGLFRDDPAAAAQSLSHLGLDRLFKEGATEPKSLSSLCLNQLFKDDPKLRESLSNLGTRRLFHQAKPAMKMAAGQNPTASRKRLR